MVAYECLRVCQPFKPLIPAWGLTFWQGMISLSYLSLMTRWVICGKLFLFAFTPVTFHIPLHVEYIIHHLKSRGQRTLPMLVFVPRFEP
jgi:hypothetical protein